MDQTTWVIKVLDDSRNRSIEYRNRVWLQRNVEKLNIRVCVEDSVVDTFGIAKNWAKEGTILVQNGEIIEFRSDFHPGKEALLIVKYQSEDKDEHIVFLYSPKE